MSRFERFPLSEMIKSVLVLEDDAFQQIVWGAIFQVVGIPSTCVNWASSAEAFERMFRQKLERGESYDLVICDIQITGEKNGVELWKKYAHTGATFCLVSAISRAKFDEMIDLYGGGEECAFISKPVSPHQCKEILEAIVIDRLFRDSSGVAV